MTTATAVINPLSRARLRTTSIKPRRKKPSTNENKPAYARYILVPSYKRGSELSLYLKGNDGRDSQSERVEPFWLFLSHVMPELLDCLSQQKTQRSFRCNIQLPRSSQEGVDDSRNSSGNLSENKHDKTSQKFGGNVRGQSQG